MKVVPYGTTIQVPAACVPAGTTASQASRSPVEAAAPTPCSTQPICNGLVTGWIGISSAGRRLETTVRPAAQGRLVYTGRRLRE